MRHDCPDFGALDVRGSQDLRDRLQRPSGEVIFTTIQKLLPERESDRNPRLSDRHNIVVIADEAHRTT